MLPAVLRRLRPVQSLPLAQVLHLSSAATVEGTLQAASTQQELSSTAAAAAAATTSPSQQDSPGHARHSQGQTRDGAWRTKASPSFEGKHVLTITPANSKRTGLEHVLVHDVLNFLEDPIILPKQVKARYSRDFKPAAFYVLFDTQQQRDAALRAHPSKQPFLGTCPVRLSAGNPLEVSEAQVPLSRLGLSQGSSSSSGQQAGPEGGKAGHSGRVALVTCDSPLDQEQLVDDFFAGYDLVYPRLRQLLPPLEQGQQQRPPAKDFRGLLFFATPDEASRAVRSRHNQTLGGSKVRISIIP